MGVFIRCLWSAPTKARPTSKIRRDIELSVKDQAGIADKTVTYVFGTENQRFLTSLGIKSILLDKSECIYPRDNRAYWHKLDAFRVAIREHGEILFIDFDHIQRFPLPDNFWPKLREKSKFQAPLFLYSRRKLLYREGDHRKAPSAAFVYVADPTYIDQMIEVRESWGYQPDRNHIATEELVMGRWLDTHLYPKWPGVETYIRYHEPYWCQPCHKTAVPEEHRTPRKDWVFKFR